MIDRSDIYLREIQRLDTELAKARAELAATKMLLEEQGRALAAARASVAYLRERLDTYMPIDSVLGDWAWSSMDEEGLFEADALLAAGKALAHVEREQAKGRDRG